MQLEVSVIRALRIAKGMTQRQLADRARLSTGALFNYENGHAEASPDVAARIAATLGCEIEDLTDGLVAAYVAEPLRLRPLEPRGRDT